MAKSDTRRSFMKKAATGLAALSAAAMTNSTQAQSKKPNILLLFTDDQRFNTIRALGNWNIRTPNIDRMVSNGTVFTNAYIMGGTSGAVCMPSRAMLMTGRHIFHLENHGASIPMEHAIMPEHFRKSGYTTFGTGKQHNGRRAYARSFTTGGKIFFGGMSDHYKVPVNDFDPTGEYPKEGIYYKTNVHSSELFSSEAVNFLNGYQEDAPFFMYVAFTAPHDPRDMPQRYLDMYDPDNIPLSENFMPEHPFDNGELKIRDELLAPFPRTPKEIRKHLAAYYAMITHLDDQIGTVIQALKDSGRYDDTIIVLAGDNGLAVGCHGLMGKQNVYDHSVHVPLIFSGPGIPQGEKRDAFCYLLDIFPTLCELSGHEIPGTVDGQSLAPVIDGKKKAVRDSLFFLYKHYQRGLRNDRWKLIRYNVSGEHPVQLFDLKNDPNELENLAHDPKHSGTVTAMTSVMNEWIRYTGDKVDFKKADWGVGPMKEPWDK